MSAIVEDQLPPQAARSAMTPVRGGRRAWLTLALCVAVTILGFRALTAPVSSRQGPGPSRTTFPSSAAIEARYGVRFTQLDVLASGGLVELRYLVLDPDLAAAFHDPTGAHLPHVVTGSGAELTETPFHSHATAQSAGASYSILYRNDGAAVGRGDEVDITVGHLRLTGAIAR